MVAEGIIGREQQTSEKAAVDLFLFSDFRCIKYRQVNLRTISLPTTTRPPPRLAALHPSVMKRSIVSPVGGKKK